MQFDAEVDSEEVLKGAGYEIDRYRSLLPEDIVPEKRTPKRKVLKRDDSGIDWKQACTECTLSKYNIGDLKEGLGCPRFEARGTES